MEKMLATTNFSFSRDVFHSYISLVHQNVALCVNGLIDVKKKIYMYSKLQYISQNIYLDCIDHCSQLFCTSAPSQLPETCCVDL